MHTKYRTGCDHELVQIDNLMIGLMIGWLAEQAGYFLHSISHCGNVS
jgi:hypothetical protein